MTYEYEVKTPPSAVANMMPALIKAAVMAIGEPQEIEVSQDADGECRATVYREPHQSVMRREDRTDRDMPDREAT